MATDESGGQTEDRPEPLFVTTHWSVVLAAGHGDTTRADDRVGPPLQDLLVSALCLRSPSVAARRPMPRI